jgi:hypothetical protein
MRAAALADWAARHAHAWRSTGCVLLAGTVMLWLGIPLLAAQASPLGMPANASCATLAAADHTASNSAEWGVTLLRGFGAPGGWFGVDVCGNGINQASPGGANLSCDRVPADLAKTGCAPGRATYDGFGLSFQCVELITRFSAWAFGDVPWDWHGNAPDLWTAGDHPTDFAAFRNGSTQKPVPGDVLVWGAVDNSGAPWPAGPQGAHDGHVAVVASVHGNQITTAEENVLWGQDNHPSDTLALAQSGGRWYIGTTAASALPAYRWPATMSTTRALYGWLHSSKNSGVFNGSGAVRGTTVPAPTPTTRPAAPAASDTTGGLPSLASGVVVTDGGTLADLVWTPSAGAADPRATVRGLGAPSGVRLAAGQTAAVSLLPSGERDVYVLGTDGQLYEARTRPQQAGVDWRGLGAPGGVRLSGSVVAATIPNAVALAAIGGDGQLWWRAGPAGNLGGWAKAGRPTTTPLQDTPVFVGAPGSGNPLAVALGADGKLYTAQWSNATTSAGWGAWQQVSFPASAATLYGPLVPLSEMPTQHAAIGTWHDVSLDLVVRDASGQLWLLRRSASQPVWTPQALPPSTSGAAPIARLLGGVVVPPASGGASITIHLYATTTQGTVLGRVALDLRGRPAPATWAALPPAAAVPPPSALANPGAAMALGPDLSALVQAAGQTVLLGGNARAHALLTPPSGGAASATASAAQAAQLWPAGAVPTADSFSDPFTGPALDPRWVPLAPGAPAPTEVSGARARAPVAAPARAAIAQLAPGTVTVRVTLPAGAPPTTQAGLAFTLDAGNQLTLAVARSGTVSLCAIAAGQSAPCATRALSAADVTAGVLLRVITDGTTFTGQVSTDGFTWQSIGGWNATSAAPATAPAASATGTAAPLTTPGWTHLTFTTLALFATDSAPTPPASAPAPRAWPTFAQFSITG